MSIFRRDSEPSPASSSTPSPRSSSSNRSQPAAARQATYIASGTKFTGEISGDTEIVVDGYVEGEIRVGSRVVIGPKGQVSGGVQALSVQLGGRVVGNVVASERVEILASGSLEGDVTAKRVAMAEGATVNGKVQMNTKAVSPNKATTEAQPMAAASGGRGKGPTRVAKSSK